MPRRLIAALASKHCEKGGELETGPIVGPARACSTYALAGATDAAERPLQKRVAAEKQQYVRHIFLARASVALMDDQRTLEWLEKA